MLGYVVTLISDGLSGVKADMHVVTVPLEVPYDAHPCAPRAWIRKGARELL